MLDEKREREVGGDVEENETKERTIKFNEVI
jgi:hypothetical protein